MHLGTLSLRAVRIMECTARSPCGRLTRNGNQIWEKTRTVGVEFMFSFPGVSQIVSFIPYAHTCGSMFI